MHLNAPYVSFHRGAAVEPPKGRQLQRTCKMYFILHSAWYKKYRSCQIKKLSQHQKISSRKVTKKRKKFGIDVDTTECFEPRSQTLNIIVVMMCNSVGSDPVPSSLP